MKKILTINLLITLILMLSVCHVSADRRNFVWSYEYATMPKGDVEIEQYTTVRMNKEAKHFKETYREQMFEVEYGITDHFDVGFYQLYRQKPNSIFEYRGYKLRFRYRFGDEGDFFLDPLLYLEWIQKGDEIELEEKIILGKSIGNFISAFNLTLEQEWDGKKLKTIIAPSLGLGYQCSPNFTFGMEALTHMVKEKGKQQNSAWFAGPTLSFSGGKAWASLGFMPQITNELTDHYQYRIRLIMGIFL